MEDNNIYVCIRTVNSNSIFVTDNIFLFNPFRVLGVIHIL